MNGVFGFQLVLSVGAAFIGVIVSLIGTFFWLGGWGLALALWFALNCNFGWKILKMGVGIYGARHNGEIAGTMMVFTNVLIGIALAIDPPRYSSWWGLLTPIVFIVITVLLQFIYGTLLDATHATNKR